MILRFSLLAALLFASSHADDLPACQPMPSTTYQRYHEQDKCNHAWQTSQQLRDERAARHFHIGKTGEYPLIPTQRTVVCPLEPVDLSSAIVGQDTRWIVENKASTAAVLIFWDNGVERSAMNGAITPPQADPHAIIQPGEYKVVNTHEGHVFYVREVLEDGSTGEILLQHRPGVVEFTNRFGKELDCGNVEGIEEHVDRVENEEAGARQHSPFSEAETSTALSDTTSSTKPTANIADNNSNNSPPTTVTSNQATSPAHSQTTMNQPNSCNMIYQGFRNALPNCPLDVYYAGAEQGITNGPMQCNEKLKFHLGTQALDNAVDYDAQLKFELTYVGHSFVARLASDPSVVVDSFTLQPTEIHDCPSRKQKTVVVDQVIEFNGIQNANANLQNNTAMEDSLTVVLSCNANMLLNDRSS